MKIDIKENDVIFPLFTEGLRDHLQTELHKEIEESQIRMKEDGWGVTKFGEPNPRFYGDHTVHFYSYFRVNMPDAVLNKKLELVDKVRPQGKTFMRAYDVKDGKFKLKILNSEMDERCFKYFKDFEFDLENYGKDFYLMGCGFR